MTLLYVLVSHFCSRDLMVSSKKMDLYLTCARILAGEAHSESIRAYLKWIWQKLGDVISWVRVSNVGMVGGCMCTPKNPMIGHLWLSQLMWNSVLIHTVLERYSSKLSQVFLARKICSLYVLLQILVFTWFNRRGPGFFWVGCLEHAQLQPSISIQHI